jgi:hypothetical protein
LLFLHIAALQHWNFCVLLPLFYWKPQKIPKKRGKKFFFSFLNTKTVPPPKKKKKKIMPKAYREEEGEGKSKLLSYEYNTFKAQAHPELVAQCVYEGLEFGVFVPLNRMLIYCERFRISKIDKRGRPRFTILRTMNHSQKPIQRIMIRSGVPVLTNRSGDVFVPHYSDDALVDVRKQMIDPREKLIAEIPNFLGRVFTAEFKNRQTSELCTGIVKEIRKSDMRVSFLFHTKSGSVRRLGCRHSELSFVEPGKGPQIVFSKTGPVEHEFATGFPYTPWTWKRDYSHEKMIALCLLHANPKKDQGENFPLPVIKHIIDYWYWANANLV